MAECMTADELVKSTEILPRHACCDAAEWNLDPPSRGSGWAELKYGRMKVHANLSWHWAAGDVEYDITYCPWCGEKLPELTLPVSG